MAIKESGEMYLETIYLLSQTNDHVRAIDICEEMGFSKPSVSRAMGKLKADGYLKVDDFGHITLTTQGKKLATKIYERHSVLSQLFIDYGVDKKTATEDACRIEHVISDKSFNAIKKHMKNK